MSKLEITIYILFLKNQNDTKLKIRPNVKIGGNVILNNLAGIFTKNTTQNTTTNTIVINLPKLRHRITRVTATLPWYIIPSPRPFDHCVSH